MEDLGRKLFISSLAPFPWPGMLLRVIGDSADFAAATAMIEAIIGPEAKHLLQQKAIEMSAESFHCVRPVTYLRHMVHQLLRGEEVCGLSLEREKTI
jgi:hypothetical protein